MSYKLLPSGGVQRLDDGAFIPLSADNADWQQYQAWLAHDNKPFPVDAIDPRDAIKAQLAAIDAATGSVRWIRELALGTNQLMDAVRAGPCPNLPPAGSGMAKVQAIEDQAAALRKQLAALG